MKQIVKKFIKSLLFTVVSALVLYALLPPSSAAHVMTVDYLDVGQGDAILITLPSGYQVLIDGGPDQRVLSELRTVMSASDRAIDLVVLTHGDADHLTGLVDVLKDYDVGLVMMPDAPKQTKLYKAWEKLLADRNQVVQLVHEKSDVPLTDGAVLHVLHPTDQTYAPGEPVNNASVVLRLDYGETTFLFTGDIEAEIERRLVKIAALEINADVLKVPHHGSKSSSTPDFIAAVSPAVSVVQVGRANRYGHPVQAVLDRLEAAGSLVFRTDQLGAIRLQSDGCLIERPVAFTLFGASLVGKRAETVYNSCKDR